MKRDIELVILSDIHLGTHGCRAQELLHYLDKINPETLILNGDIIDIWQFNKGYFPQSHMLVLKKIMEFTTKGTRVIYITGNHDELLRKFTDLKLGNFFLTNKVVLQLDGKKAWIFHGDVFDASIQHSKWLAKMGGWGYDTLIRINVVVNMVLKKMGRERYSLSKKIKSSVKKAVKYISDFEKTASELAIENGYDYVICGHIHQPQIHLVKNKKGETLYLNSGDWIENLSSLEYDKGRFELFLYDENKEMLGEVNPENYKLPEMELDELLKAVLKN